TGGGQPVGEGDGDHHRPDTRPEHGDDEDAEQQVRDGGQGVDHTHDQTVGPAAERAGGGADGRADHRGGERGHHAHQQRHPEPVDAAQQQVAAHVVGAGGVAPARGQELGGQVDGLLVELDQRRYQQDREDRHGDQDGGDAQAEG